jgi:hypothetical protein
LVFDGDTTGKKKLEQALELFAGDKNIRVRVIALPDGEDPDSFIREKGKDAFLALARWSSFDWKLNKFTEQDDEIEICKKMVPFIVNEPSPIVRDQLVKTLSTRTGIAIKAIHQELSLLLDEKSMRRSRARQDILDKAMYELRNTPEDAEVILYNAQSNLLELSKASDQDTLSSEDFVRALDRQKEQEEKSVIANSGFKLGEDLKELQEVLRGDWSKGAFICWGASPNVGKTAILSKIAYEIANNNDDVVVIYHTIDDTAEQLIPRFVCIAEGSTQLSINMVREPNYWTSTAGIAWVDYKRNIGYAKVRKLAQESKLIVKDVSHGCSLPFAENLICYYQDRFPDRRIVFILDNFHKLRDFNGKDERVRFKAISEAVKNITLRRQCCIMSSVEYTKLAPGAKPSNYNVAESSFTIFHEEHNWNGEPQYLPRLECIVGKNKISEVKKSFFLDFYPASSDYRGISHKQVLEDAEKNKDKGSQSNDEMKELYG